MDVLIGINGGDEVGDLTALADWLRAERALQGTVRVVRREVGETELGGGLDALSVAVGSGGVGVALAQSLSVWLRARRSDIKITITAKGRTIEIDARRVGDPLGLITQALEGADDADR